MFEGDVPNKEPFYVEVFAHPTTGPEFLIEAHSSVAKLAHPPARPTIFAPTHPWPGGTGLSRPMSKGPRQQ